MAKLALANFQDANLWGADLTGANLWGADLRDVSGLTCEQLAFAMIDRQTRLPDYIKINWLSKERFECTKE